MGSAERWFWTSDRARILRRLWLFVRILWRRYEGSRMAWRLSWDVTGCLEPPVPYRPWGASHGADPGADTKALAPDHGFNSERSQRAENGGRP